MACFSGGHSVTGNTVNWFSTLKAQQAMCMHRSLTLNSCHTTLNGLIAQQTMPLTNPELCHTTLNGLKAQQTMCMHRMGWTRQGAWFILSRCGSTSIGPHHTIRLTIWKGACTLSRHSFVRAVCSRYDRGTYVLEEHSAAHHELCRTPLMD
jgi:hypothetical protein